MKLVSPESMMSAARQEMLDGREPATATDWQLVVNFIAFNADPILAHAATKMMCMLYDIPLDAKRVDQIVKYQLARRASLN